MKIEKTVYSQSEALYAALETAENAKDLAEMFAEIVGYCTQLETKNCDNPFSEAVKNYLKECNFEALTRQTKEQIGLNPELEFYVD